MSDVVVAFISLWQYHHAHLFPKPVLKLHADPAKLHTLMLTAPFMSRLLPLRHNRTGRLCL